MKAIVYNKKKSKDKLECCEIEKPVVRENELLIQVHATSINAADYRLMKMGMAPKKKIFGADIAGVVISIGKGVQNFKVGDSVMGDLSNFGFGGFAEYVAIPQNAIVIKPANISFEEAAALPLAGITALQALRDKGNIQKDYRVLIVGSSGGVGTFALQLAKYYGAVVTAVCSPKNKAQAKLLGADRVIDYTKEDFGKETLLYDIIIAVNGNYPLSTYKRCLTKSGKFVLVGGALPQIFKTLFFGKFLSLGSKKMMNLFAKANQKDMEFVGNLVNDRKIKPAIEKIYPLENALEGIGYVADGHASGKVIIKVK